jgi:methylphosphotriester-DNA--protein-cysteine methyltransferase
VALNKITCDLFAHGQCVKNRGFFIDEWTAVAAGYRPCAVCLPDEFAQWKERSSGRVGAGADAQ